MPSGICTRRSAAGSRPTCAAGVGPAGRPHRPAQQPCGKWTIGAPVWTRETHEKADTEMWRQAPCSRVSGEDTEAQRDSRGTRAGPCSPASRPSPTGFSGPSGGRLWTLCRQRWRGHGVPCGECDQAQIPLSQRRVGAQAWPLTSPPSGSGYLRLGRLSLLRVLIEPASSSALPPASCPGCPQPRGRASERPPFPPGPPDIRAAGSPGPSWSPWRGRPLPEACFLVLLGPPWPGTPQLASPPPPTPHAPPPMERAGLTQDARPASQQEVRATPAVTIVRDFAGEGPPWPRLLLPALVTIQLLPARGAH